VTRAAVLALVVAVAGAYGLKRHFSRARVDDLGWILAPTAALAGAVADTDFVRTPGEGWVSREHHFVIAKACAGVNFLIVAFVAPVCAFAGVARRKALLVAGSAAAAYLATIVVNAARIALAVQLADGLADADALTRERLHRVEGVVVYSLALCLFFLAARRTIVGRTS
jgi:exosortase K